MRISKEQGVGNKKQTLTSLIIVIGALRIMKGTRLCPHVRNADARADSRVTKTHHLT